MSTAGIWDKTSIWWRIREKARQIRDGIVKQENFLPVLYIADPEKDDPEDEELWKRVNPSLGYIFTMEKIREQYRESKQDPVEYQNFLRFRLNIPVKQISRWMPMDAWDKCGGSIDPGALEGKKCYGGLDMSTKIDLSAFVLVFPPQEDLDRYVILPRFYVPEDTIMKRSKQDAVHYEIWQKEGYLTATPGNVIDEEFIEKDVVEASKRYALIEAGFDPWGATAISNKLLNTHGIQMVEVRQGSKSLSEPAKDVLAKVKQGKLNHGNHPVLRWCADNLVMVTDANENVRPDKEKATERIDGMVALFNAWNRITQDKSLGPSVYETEGLLIV
jgi:phage terminase large subunit-like protein